MGDLPQAHCNHILSVVHSSMLLHQETRGVEKALLAYQERYVSFNLMYDVPEGFHI